MSNELHSKSNNSLSGKVVIDGMLDLTAKLPVPMIGPITKGLKSLTGLLFHEPDPFEKVQRQLNAIEGILQDMYSLIKRANDISNVATNTNTIISLSSSLRDLIKRGNESEIEDIKKAIHSMRSSFDQVNLTLDPLTSGYQKDFVSITMPLSEYVWNYNLFADMLLNPASIALEAMDRSSEYLQHLIDNRKTSKAIKEKCQATIEVINDAITHIKGLTDLFLGEQNQKNGTFYKNYPPFLKDVMALEDGKKIRIELVKNSNDFMCVAKKQQSEKKTAFVQSLKKDIGKHPEDYYKNWRLKVVDKEINPETSKWEILQTDNYGALKVRAIYYDYTELVNTTIVHKNEWRTFVGNDPKAVKPSISKINEEHDQYAIVKIEHNYLRFVFTTNSGGDYSLEAGTKQKSIDSRPAEPHKVDQQWKIKVE